MREFGKRLRDPTVYALLSILALGAFLRFFELARYPPGLHADEAINGINTLQVVRLHHISVFYPENNGREGLFINAQAVAVWLFGASAWALRMVSGIFGVATILGLFFLVREIFSSAGPRGPTGDRAVFDATRVALLSAFLLSASFWHVLISRLGFRAISAPFWAVWAFYFLLRSWRILLGNRRTPPSPARWFARAFFAGIVFGLGFHSYIAYRATPLLLALLFASQLRDARRRGAIPLFLKHAAAVVAGSTIAIAPLAMYFVQHPHDFIGRAGQLSVFASKRPVVDFAANLVTTIAMFNVVGDTNPRHNLTGRPWLARFARVLGASPLQQRLVGNLGRPQLFWPVGIFFLIGLWTAVRRLVHYERLHEPVPLYPSFFLLAWLLVAAIPVVLSNDDLPHALRSVLMIPPVFTLAAMGALLIYEFAVRRVTGMAVVAVLFCVLLVVQTYVTYFVVWGPAPLTADRFDGHVKEQADALLALPREVPKYVLVPNGAVGVEILQFLTDSYTPETQQEKHIRYVDPRAVQLETLPPGAYVTRLQ